MERYFCRDKKDYCDILNCKSCEFAKGSGVINGVYVEDVLSTLFGDAYNLDRLRELVQADQEGRCVVLPAKVGSTVYRIGASVCKYRNLDKCDEYCDGDQYADCWEGEQIVVPETFRLNILESVGKTVFRTREEGEAALKAMKGRE